MFRNDNIFSWFSEPFQVGLSIPETRNPVHLNGLLAIDPEALEKASLAR
jgi:hypothetical protein